MLVECFETKFLICIVLTNYDILCATSADIKRASQQCQHIPGDSIDILIGKLLVERMKTSTIEIALSVQNELISQFEATDRIHYQHVENAKYEMNSAKRRYMAIDPTNRLVADELESDWNHKIRAYRDSHENYNRRKSEDHAYIVLVRHSIQIHRVFLDKFLDHC